MTSPLRTIPAALLTFCLAGAAAAGPLVPTRASQLYAARTGSGNVQCPFGVVPGGNTPYLIDVMVGSDGVEQPFAIPAKQVFVVTGFDFAFGGPVSGTIVVVHLTSFDAMGQGSILAQGTATTGANQIGGGSVVVPHGVAVRGDRTLCITGTAGATGGVVQGFFAKDK